MPKLKFQKKYLISGGIFVIAVLLALMLLAPHTPAPDRPVPSEPAPPTGYYGMGEFSLDEKGFMTYAGEYTTGIDVSDYQGTIDWQSVRQAGISFVFIKVGSRGTTEGKLYAENLAQSYYAGAKAAGLQVGAYFYSQAITPQEAEEEADFALAQIAGWELDLPLAYDWEWGGEGSRTTGLSRDTLTQCAHSFCQAVEAAGYEPMLYFNESQGLEQMELEELTDYPFWLAQYDGEMTFPYPFVCWQYSHTGQVPGIEGNVDLNIQILERAAK